MTLLLISKIICAIVLIYSSIVFLYKFLGTLIKTENLYDFELILEQKDLKLYTILIAITGALLIFL